MKRTTLRKISGQMILCGTLSFPYPPPQESLFHPNIIHAAKQVSPWDFELEIMVEDYKGYKRILHEMSAQFPKLIQYTESALMTEDVVFPSKIMFFE